MARRPAPTKASLFKAQGELRFATEGRDLLQQKRDVLVMELMTVTAAFSETEKTLRESLVATLDMFLPAYLAAGRDGMDRVYGPSRPELSLAVDTRPVMGILVPEVSVESGSEPVFPGLLDGSPAMDRSVAAMDGVVKALAHYVQIAATIWRLATEVDKTQRRINAIDNVFIPESRGTVQWIRSVMEENDREELFRRKLLKNRASETGESDAD